MTISSTLPTSDDDFDCCIVGAGPVGLSLALEAAAAGLRVLLLDAGPANAVESSATLAARPTAHVLNPAVHAPLEQGTARGLGGTSRLWGGRCVQFETVDFLPRDYLSDSGWPLGMEDVSPCEAAAADYLDCGIPEFHDDSFAWEGMDEAGMSQLERWARRPRLAARLGARVAANADILVLCDAVVTDIDMDAAGSTVTGVAVRHQGRTLRVRARSYVLACGGLETTRLLLRVQRDHPHHFGGSDGPLGRYYMGHLQGSIANIHLADPADIRQFDYRLDEHNSYVRRRFTFSARGLQERRLLNTSFHLDNPPFYDAGHRNSTLSLVFLALSVAPLGRRLVAEAIRLRHLGPRPRDYAGHVRNLARNPFRGAADIVRIIVGKYLSPVRKPGYLLQNAGGIYALHFHAEQAPDPQSRVWLNTSANADGQPGLDIDFRYSQQDLDSVLASHRLLDEELRRSGQGELEYLDAVDAREASVMAQATDGFHHIGTTRMSVSPADGVVDRDCRVHGLENLFIASSSVFRTAGEANPTFLAVCLAVRLARHLPATLRPDSDAADVTAVLTDQTPIDVAPA